MKWRENMAMKALAFMAAGGGVNPTPQKNRVKKGKKEPHRTQAN